MSGTQPYPREFRGVNCVLNGGSRISNVNMLLSVELIKEYAVEFHIYMYNYIYHYCIYIQYIIAKLSHWVMGFITMCIITFGSDHIYTCDHCQKCISFGAWFCNTRIICL